MKNVVLWDVMSTTEPNTLPPPISCMSFYWFILRSTLQLLVTSNVFLSSLILSALMMEAKSFSEKSVLTRETRRHVPEHGILRKQKCVKLCGNCQESSLNARATDYCWEMNYYQYVMSARHPKLFWIFVYHLLSYGTMATCCNSYDVWPINLSYQSAHVLMASMLMDANIWKLGLPSGDDDWRPLFDRDVQRERMSWLDHSALTLIWK
jgi:hypothetical protein